MKTGIKLKAFQLRKKGKSYREIAQYLKISKGTISYWFKNINWSESIKKQLGERAKIISTERLSRLIVLRKKTLNEAYQKAEYEAKKEFRIYKNNPLFISGVMLYWGEGDKNFKSGAIKVTNTDPAMIRIFREFLLKILHCEETKIKGWLLLYPDLNIKKCLGYWVADTNIPLGNFTKPTVIDGKHKTHRLPYGVCTISITNKYFKKKILTWIDLYKDLYAKENLK